MKILSLNGCGIEDVPDLSALTDLKILDLGNNKIFTLGGFPSGLVELILDNNDICDILQITKHVLPNLKKLSVKKNRLAIVPPSLGSVMMNLEFLDISDNKTYQLTREIANLRNLRELYVSNNRMTEIPLEVCKLPLVVLDFSNNRLTRLPSRLLGMGTGITDLKETLQKLILHDNKISEIPSEAQNLKKLTVFDVSKNKLGKVPSAVYGMTSLKELYLGQNSLTSIPRKIIDLQNKLKVLSVDMMPSPSPR